jgi:preprotein translocase subunit SecF
MDTSELHHKWARWRRIKPWHFLVLAVISAVICVFALRDNNLRMVELRQAVYQADEANGDVEGTLRALREHVYAHMNTNLAAGTNVRPPIQLKYTYERLVAQRNAGSATSTAGNSEIYNQAQQECEKQIPTGFSGSNRLSCIQDYVKSHSLATATSEPIPKNLYQFDFVSPRWSPDLAGWSLVATAFFGICFIISWIFRHIIRRMVQ